MCATLESPSIKKNFCICFGNVSESFIVFTLPIRSTLYENFYSDRFRRNSPYKSVFFIANSYIVR